MPPRIRTIKPEALQHRKVGKLTDQQFRLWIGLITQADDDGRLVADPDQLRVLAFGYFPRVTVAAVQAAVQALAEVGLIRLYTVAGVRYADLPSWRDHQRINRPTPSRLPAYEDSVGVHGGFSEPPVRPHAGSEGIGSERITTLSSANGARPPVSLSPNGDLAEAEGILLYLNRSARKAFRPGDVNLKLITARLKAGATPELCRLVIDRKVQAWRGDPKMAEYLRPKTLFNATNFEQYVGELPSAERDEDDDDAP